MLCNAAPSLTSAVTLATVVKTHSAVNSGDCQGPECTRRPSLPWPCSSRTWPSILCPVAQEPHLNPSPLSFPVQCCRVGLCPALSPADTDSLPGLPRLTTDPLSTWRLSDDHWRANLSITACTSALLRSKGTGLCQQGALPILWSHSAASRAVRPPCSCCCLTKPPVFTREKLLIAGLMQTCNFTAN